MSMTCRRVQEAVCRWSDEHDIGDMQEAVCLSSDEYDTQESVCQFHYIFVYIIH